MKNQHSFRRRLLTLTAILFICTLLFVSCNLGDSQSTKPTYTDSTNTNSTPAGTEQTPNTHVHAFGEWTQTAISTCTEAGVNERYCSCGEKQTQTIAATGHTEVIDEAIAATCTEDGKTEGKHCGRCNAILIAQSTIPSLGSHTYDAGNVVSEAACNADGTIKYTCTVVGCNHSCTESYSLPTYTATELYNQSIEYVGEIVTWDKYGNAISMATGFAISADGKFVTNYHVIEGACSAYVTINGKEFTVSSVLAYDKTIDLAVLKIDASGLTAATVCKKPVQVGDTVYAIGSSRGMTNTYSQGTITYANRILDDVSHVQHNAAITEVSSGGPLINVYGEVIGINTWGISDSQNINFAVFTSELDNLIYGSPLTLAEFSDPFEKLKMYIIDNGLYYSAVEGYMLTLGTEYDSDHTTEYTRQVFYDESLNQIYFYLHYNDGENTSVAFTLDDALSGEYLWSYWDNYDQEMQGVVYANTFDDNTLLGYHYNNISDDTLRNFVREMASSMMAALCWYIDLDLFNMGVSAPDLGFYYYYL